MPTSRATRVTSSVNSASWSTIALTVRPIRRNSPRSGRSPLRSSMRWDRSPSATASITRATSVTGPDQVVDQGVGVLVGRRPRCPRAPAPSQPLGQPAVAAGRTPDPAQLGGQPGVALGDLVVGAGQLEQDAVPGLGQPAAELAVPHVLERREQPAYRDLVDGRLRRPPRLHHRHSSHADLRLDLDDERDDHRAAAVGVAHPLADGAPDQLLRADARSPMPSAGGPVQRLLDQRRGPRRTRCRPRRSRGRGSPGRRTPCR